ncbi:type IA DNA topoisomerase [Paenibacillus taichungensis]|uniref:type IA DNA topoisomerase n=1 Tax=Paenibacillus taichungensis TaxID=484184 RepID=UPI0035DA219D
MRYNRVILAEKPDMGASIAQALGISSKKRGYIELQNGDVVTWAIGHLVQEKTPDAYPEYKEWNWDSLPIIPAKMVTEVDPKKLDQFNIVKDLLFKSKDCILATDPDREGEYIGRLILNQCGYTKKFKRLWIDDLTESTIQNGMRNLKESDDFELLGLAAQTRSYADYWLGFTASRFFTLIGREASGGFASLPAGRVQTPTLRLVYDRELEMENFTPKPFYVLQADIQTSKGSFKGQWYHGEGPDKVTRFTLKDKADELKKKITAGKGRILSYKTRKVKRQAPQLFNSSALKTEARKKLAFSTVQTTKHLQSLYDKGYISYPRADSRHLSENKADELANHLQIILAKGEYKTWFPQELISLKGKARFVDDKKAATHHAIVPTDKIADPNKPLTPDEVKLHELILKQTLAAHHLEGEDLETEIITEIEGETFTSRAVEIRVKGWRSLIKPETDAEPNNDSDVADRLPVLEEGDPASAASVNMITGKTSKPKRLNDDELEKLMENAGQFVEEETEDGVIEQLKERGIGTPATRTNIVEKLAKQEYIEVTKNLVYLTSKGRSFMQMVHDHPLSSVELTGEFEMKLSQVERGEITAEELQNEFREYTHKILETKDQLLARIKDTSQFSFENVEEVGVCPRCGKKLIDRQKGYSCSSGRECGFIIWKDFRGVTIKSKQATMLAEGKEILLKNIPGKEGKAAYDLYLKILPDGKMETRLPTTEDQSLGACPKCGKSVIEGGKTFSCSGWKEGCDFKIWKTHRKLELPAAAVKSLLGGKKIHMKGFPSEKGMYDMILFMENGVLNSRYPEPAELSLGECPICKGHVTERATTFNCSDVKCSFRLTKTFLTQNIKASQIKKLLKSGKTDVIEGLKGGKNGTFDTRLGYDQVNNRYSFVKE